MTTTIICTASPIGLGIMACEIARNVRSVDSAIIIDYPQYTSTLNLQGIQVLNRIELGDQEKLKPLLRSLSSDPKRKFLYLDFGYLYFINNTQTNLYNSTISIYLPLGYFSIGASTRYLTDFKQKNMIVASAGLKFNFGFVKKYNSDDKREIETSILKLKQ